MKLVEASTMDIVNHCRQMLCFDQPSIMLARRTEKVHVQT